MSWSFSQFGNDLYTGRRSIPAVPHRKRFYIVSAVILLVALGGLLGRGLNLSLEFRGGSEFRVATAAAPSGFELAARQTVADAGGGNSANVTRLGAGTIRVQTELLDDAQSSAVRTALAEEFGVPETDVSATFIGPSWGASVSQQALRALIIFLVLTGLVMALYFRTWKMAAAALAALLHDLVVVVGIFTLLGFEISPATMIGFLTVLGYSIYDTVVVFDKVRENTTEAFANGRMSYAEAANLAVSQTFVRSVNTTVVGGLPIVAVLVVGALYLGPGVLLDLSLVLFIGMVVGAYSSIFIATPLLVSMRAKEERVIELDKRAKRSQAARAKAAAEKASAPEAATVAAGTAAGEATARGEGAAYDPVGTSGTEGAASTATGRAVHKWAQTGPRNQPKRTPKSQR